MNLQEMFEQLERSTERREPKFTPAKMVHIREILEATAQEKFKIGDIITLRSWAAPFFKIPEMGQNVIVTQVLPEPHRSGEPGTPAEARARDVAVALLDPDGDVVEVLFDSRGFKKVGSIYDPIEFNGEMIPTV